MRKLVRSKYGKTNGKVREKALELISGLPPKAYLSEVKALHEFVRDEIRYVKDIRGVETLHDPFVLLENLRVNGSAQGDCDDKAILLSALLESIGHKTRFIAVGFDGKNFSHVYLETKIGRRWIPLETTEPVNVGWKPEGVNLVMRQDV